MIYMLTIDGTQHGCYTKSNAVAALTRLRAEGLEVAALTRLRAEGLDGEAQIKQIHYDHDAEMADKMRGVSN